MAVTRINNNQISDASAGNAYVGINAATKLQPYSITATKIANNLTYGSDLTVTGNLTVQGNTTAIDTTYTTIEDPILLLASTQTGTPSVDIGFVGERGTSDNIAFVWDESAAEFVTVYTTSGETNTTISIASYADLHTGNSNVGGNLVVNGTSSLVGNVLGNINLNGNINAANGYFTNNVTVNGTLTSTSNIIANSSGIFYGNSVTGNGAIYGGVPGYTILGSDVVIQFAGNANSYSQVNFQNINPGTSASTDYIATADDGDDSNFYIDVGIGSSTFDDPVDYPGFFPHDSYVHAHGGNLLINPETAGKVIKFMVGGTDTSDIIATMSNTAMGVTGLVSVTGNITGGNINSNAQIVATSNITGSNLNTAGQVVATGNITGGNISTAGQVVATGNITGGNLTIGSAINTGTLDTTGNAVIGGNLFVLGNITYNNVEDLRIQDPVIIMGTGPNGAPLTGPDSYDRGIYMEWYKTGLGNSWMGWENSSGNMIVAADVFFSGNDVIQVNSYGTLQAGNIYAESAVAVGNITGGNLITPGSVTSTGNINAPGIINNNAGMTIDGGFPGYLNFYTGGTVKVSIDDNGNINGGNIIASGATISATSAANVTFGDNTYLYTGYTTIYPAGIFHNTGANPDTMQVSTGSLANGIAMWTNGVANSYITSTGGIEFVTGATLRSVLNPTGGTSTAAITANGLTVGGIVSATGNITGANLNTGGTNGLTLNASTINSNAASIAINSNGSDVDFAVNGDTSANIFYVDAGTGTVSVGTEVQTTGAIFAMNSPTSFMMPVGNTSQRPGTGVTGMLRFNSTLDAVEVYDSAQWTTVGTPNFTVITDEQFNGDGSTVAFTLAAATTTNSTIVSINGIVQIPTLAYSVGGGGNDVLTFTEAPENGDIIDVRKLTTTTQVTSISNSPGNAVISVNPTVNEVSVTGNLVPVANVTQSLGSPTAQWKDIYVAGNTIYLGGLQLQASGNTFAVYTSDGVTQANVDVGNVDIAAINSGTSTIGISAPNGNAYITVGGTSNVIVASTTGAAVTGILSVSGNIVSTGSNGVANIGSATTYFNTVHAKATSAQYADLAENYVADAAYAPGTVLSFGGEHEVTVSKLEGDQKIAGVVSTNPSYIMNSVLDAEHVATLALTGRVPTFVSGVVEKGDMMVSAGNGRAVACATPAMGTVIGKALENHAGGDGVIEVVVGRM